MTIQEYFGDWSKLIDLQLANSIMKKLSMLSCHDNLCPSLNNVFKAFKLCPLNSLRLVILGQDVYPQRGVATGLAFANSPDTPEKSYSPSLEVLRESVIDYTIPHRTINFDPSLEKWASQGVLLLNSALSCEVGRIGSHILLWRPFIKSLLIGLSKYHTGIVYILMGTVAQSFEPYINTQFNHVVRIRHPSWYAREKKSMPSDIWRETNSILTGLNGSAINWYEEY